jgi:hypothetical protein
LPSNLSPCAGGASTASGSALQVALPEEKQVREISDNPSRGFVCARMRNIRRADPNPVRAATGHANPDNGFTWDVNFRNTVIGVDGEASHGAAQVRDPAREQSASTR